MGVWILHPKVLEFKGVKSKYSQILKGKIQILKRQDIKSKYSQTLGDKFQILKLQGIKSKHPQLVLQEDRKGKTEKKE